MKADQIMPGQTAVSRTHLANRWGVSPRTIDAWRKRGNLPAFVVSGRLIRFDLAACEEWLGKFRHDAKWENERSAS